MALFNLLNHLFHGPSWLKFVAMGAAASGLALCSFNLLFLFQANLSLIATYGAMAAFDGGILQFLQLTPLKKGLAERHAPAAQGVGLDRINCERRLFARQPEVNRAEQQSAQHRGAKCGEGRDPRGGA
jgi:hypothetical protein